MSRLDDEVSERLARAQKPVFVAPELFTGLARTKLQRERRRRFASLGSVLGVLALGVSAYLIASRSLVTAPATTGTAPATFSSPGTAAASIPGVPFPACHVSTLPYFGPDVGAVSLFGRESGGIACPPDLEAGNAYLAVYRPGLITPRSRPDIVGPIDCAKGCRIFGAPDIDGDGHPELAVVVVDGTGADSIELYQIKPRSDPPVEPIMVHSPKGTARLAFDWGGVGDYRSGAACSKSEPDVLNVWHADRRGGDWHVVQTFLRLRGSRVIDSWPGRYTTGLAAALPAGGGTDFCGGQVSP